MREDGGSFLLTRCLENFLCISDVKLAMLAQSPHLAMPTKLVANIFETHHCSDVLEE